MNRTYEKARAEALWKRHAKIQHVNRVQADPDQVTVKDGQYAPQIHSGSSPEHTFVAQDGTIVMGTDDYRAEDVEEPRQSSLEG